MERDTSATKRKSAKDVCDYTIRWPLTVNRRAWRVRIGGNTAAAILARAADATEHARAQRTRGIKYAVHTSGARHESL
ncbi:unnamed protein product, partial [Iphiclides podalirius]